MRKEDIYVRVIGGLGNQMFQYAFIKALSLKRGCNFKLDITSFDYYFRPFELDVFNIQKSYTKPFYGGLKIAKFIKRFFYYIYRIKTHFMGYYREKRVVSEFNLDFGKNRYFEGVFASPHFFENYWDEIKSDFSPKKSLSKECTDVINELKNKNTVSVHIRRGDYLKAENSYFNKLWNSDYYDNAIKYMEDNVENPVFLFFSDDMDRVKEKFKGKNYIYIDINKGKDSRQDIILMSKCKHNIVANSTFSWRGAYLNENPIKIVVRPKIYQKSSFVNMNLYPESWIPF